MNILEVYSIYYTFTKNTNLENFPSDKINGTKNAFFILSRAPAHRNFCLFVCGIFHFRFRFVFINVYIFVQQNAWTL